MCVSRDAGSGSRGGFFLSCFGRCGAGPEPEAVVAGFEDLAMVSEPIGAVMSGRVRRQII